jgi:biotin operon repressor
MEVERLISSFVEAVAREIGRTVRQRVADAVRQSIGLVAPVVPRRRATRRSSSRRKRTSRAPSAAQQKILAILQSRRGKFVSGDLLAKRSGVSKSSVLRHVRAIRRAGLRVEGQRGQQGGYRLGAR